MIRIYYRKIYVHGFKKIPNKKPVLLCSNHPNGFMEPLLIGNFLKKSIFFLVRGDLFHKPLLGWFLRNSQQIPIYRKKDGFKYLKSNHATMNWTQKALSEHKRILIFPEGGSESVKHLRPLQKGVARMAFDFMESYPEEDLILAPISVNYTYPFKERSELFITAGDVIHVKDYIPSFKENKAKAYRQLLTELKKNMTANLIHIEDKDDLQLYEMLAPINRKSVAKFSLNTVHKTKDELKGELHLSKLIAESPESQKKNWLQQIRTINEQRKKAGIISNHYDAVPNKWTDYLWILIGYIPFMIGYITQKVPTNIALWIANKYSKENVFWASLYAAISIALGIVLYVITFFVLFNFIGWFSVLVLVLIAFLGWFALHYSRYMKKVLVSFKWSRYSGGLKCEQDILKLREELSIINKLE